MICVLSTICMFYLTKFGEQPCKNQNICKYVRYKPVSYPKVNLENIDDFLSNPELFEKVTNEPFESDDLEKTNEENMSLEDLPTDDTGIIPTEASLKNDNTYVTEDIVTNEINKQFEDIKGKVQYGN